MSKFIHLMDGRVSVELDTDWLDLADVAINETAPNFTPPDGLTSTPEYRRVQNVVIQQMRELGLSTERAVCTWYATMDRRRKGQS